MFCNAPELTIQAQQQQQQQHTWAGASETAVPPTGAVLAAMTEGVMQLPR
jgi:hypothetical protein